MEDIKIPELKIPEIDNQFAIMVLKALYQSAIRLNLPASEYMSVKTETTPPPHQ